MNKTFCNVCGKEFDEYDYNAGNALFRKAHYGSKYDGQFIVLDMCLDCFDNLIESCAISPLFDDQKADKYLTDGLTRKLHVGEKGDIGDKGPENYYVS